MTAPSNDFLDRQISNAVGDWLLKTTGRREPVDPAASWSLCSVLADYGLAVSDSTGVSARGIGPYRLAVAEDVPRDTQTLLLSLVPVALTTAAGSLTTPAACVSALTYAIKVLATTLTSGCAISDDLEWVILLAVRRANRAQPPEYPTADDLLRSPAVVQFPGRKVQRADIVERVRALGEKRPIWGDRPIALLRESPTGGLEALA